MTTQEAISYLKKELPTYSRDILRTLLNDIQIYVCANPLYQFEFIDPNTGMPPFFTTVQGRYNYNLPANALRLIRILAETITYYSRTHSNRSIQQYTYNGKQYWDIPVNDRVARPGVAARAIFIDDPGATTTNYRWLYNERPTAISSENIQLTFPESTHLDLIEGVLARVRKDKYGEQSSWNNFVYTVIPRISDAMNKGIKPGRGSTPIQREYSFYSCYR
jgi:hypothetical protein